MLTTMKRAQIESSLSQKELEKVRARSERVSSDVAELADPRGRQAELRRRFDVGLPGEKLLVIVDEDHPEILPVEPITFFDRVKASLPLWARR